MYGMMKVTEKNIANRETDFLIVGQGLAGTMLAFELHRRGKNFVVVDSPSGEKASRVAAGIINPVVFRRLTKSWLVDDLFPVLKDTYHELEKLLSCHLLHTLKINKILGKEEGSFWRTKTVENKLESYIHSEPDTTFHKGGIEAPYGIGKVFNAFRADLPFLIDRFREFLIQENRFISEKLDTGDIIRKTGKVQWKNITAQKIIFCQGFRASDNPFFQPVKFKHTKGQVLDLNIPDLEITNMVNKGMFVLPLGENRFRAGATYRWDFQDTNPDDEATAELTGKMEKIVKVPYSITGKRAGIRPTTHDRRPVVGLHPDYPEIGIFNGLGSKGAMLAPFFAREFARLLCGESDTIHPEVNLLRYYRKK
ncbi:FAD-binding oxidoreductase [Prolixibacter sp. NT017]|uniref:NAD(P)/FAD-dependent oxidoreductase n=1 Tax=Prolixibacter sp. NT017 TaxID=2652390 RepID=UPI001280C900|nr:FAD-binding oxidoreductase [Prolixibacter sp. NT017]GET26566.1 FAD-dependent oxidoreductase [Prolixibacter sp. NT017]